MALSYLNLLLIVALLFPLNFQKTKRRKYPAKIIEFPQRQKKKISF